MNELTTIQSKICEFRGQKVMLDRDLASLYGVETRTLNQSVKRNADRFPNDFMFQLTDDEVIYWKAQIVMSNSVKMGLRRNPYAFTELGVAMLSSVLKYQVAIQININIMRAFVAARQMLSTDLTTTTLENNFKELKQDLEEIFTDYNDIDEDTRLQLEAINQSLAELQAKSTTKTCRPIGFKPTQQ